MSTLLKYERNWEAIRQQLGFIDDFIGGLDTFKWTATLTDTGTATVVDGTDGILPITPSDGTVADNDEAYVTTKIELFKFAADRHFIGEAHIQFTETTAGVFNCFVGFGNAMVADTLVDNGGGMRASGSTAAIYKIDGGTNWICTSRNNSVVTTNTSSAAAASASYQTLTVEVLPFTALAQKVVFRVDGVPLKDTSTGLPIVHTVLVASATEMQFGFGAKLGAITNNDVLNVDWARYAAWRASL